MKLIPTRIHGILDYLSTGTLFVLPGLLGWDETVTRRVRLVAVGTLLYSLVTRYEWGVKPLAVLPMPGHLALDGASGALFCAVPWLLPDEAPAVKNTLIGIGVFELLVTLNSQSKPQTDEEQIEGDR